MAKKIDNDRKRYSTVVEDEGENYREIANIMTELGHPMNHSSARNYVNRVMKKFLDAFVEEYDISLSDDKRQEVSKSHDFQSTMMDILGVVEAERRRNA